LSYLQRFPMDQLKIDQSFVQRVADDPNNAAITQAVISLGHSLKLKVVAEGVSDGCRARHFRKKFQEHYAFLLRYSVQE
jgi:EAL domain-containing protein (putative c-di-GMP-specific phosphodiesterase class I)